MTLSKLDKVNKKKIQELKEWRDKNIKYVLDNAPPLSNKGELITHIRYLYDLSVFEIQNNL